MSELNTTIVYVMYISMMESVIHGYNEYICTKNLGLLSNKCILELVLKVTLD